MIAEAFIMCWNEEEIITLTIKHYQKFCDQVTILDNYSTDSTVDIALKMDCDIKQFGREGVLDDKAYLEIKNTCYRNSPAKFVIVCDADEILWHPDIKEIMETSNGNIFNTIGWNVFSYAMPKDDFLELQFGVFDPNYCKKICFKPSIRINYVYGCHVCHPQGRLYAAGTPLTLFHYRNIGGPKRLSKRHELYRERMCENNKRWGLGIHYTYPEEQREREWYEKFDKGLDYSLYDHSGVDTLAF